MFEELNQHRAAVAENIQKATEIGFTGGELEKAHKVGDIHPNGKWVWTQLPSGRYDWRVIKKNAGTAAHAAQGGAAPASSEFYDAEEYKQYKMGVSGLDKKSLKRSLVSIERNLKDSKDALDKNPNNKEAKEEVAVFNARKKAVEEAIAALDNKSADRNSEDWKKQYEKEEEIKGFINILKQKPNERHFEVMDDAELKRFRDAAHKCWLDDENLNRSTRIQCKEWRDLAKQELALRAKEGAGADEFETFAANYEKEYRKKHPNETVKNSEIRQQAIKEWNKKHSKNDKK